MNSMSSSKSLSDMGAEFLHFMVSLSTKPSIHILENSFGLTTSEALLPALLLFWIFTIPFYRCVRDSTLPSYLLAFFFWVWLSLALGVECRVELSSGDNVGGVIDIVQDYLAPWHSFFNSTPVVFTNTTFILGLAIFGTYEACIRQKPALLLRALVCGVLRMTIGTLTRLPTPKDYVAVAGDWPPPPSAECSGFIFNPSGHVVASVIASLALRKQGKRGAALLVDFGCLLQSLRLIATRGHYTVDVITGILLSIVVDQNLPINSDLEEIKEKKKN